jgi:hypothetical protein
MAELSPDGTAAAILTDIVTALEGITTDGVRLFAEVAVLQDAGTFRRVANAYKGPVAGIIASAPQRKPGSDNSQAFIERIELQIAVCFLKVRAPGGGEKDAADAAALVASLVRQALLVDRTRGGRAEPIPWDGGLLDGTDVTGTIRYEAKRPGQSSHLVTVPCTVGWSKAA